MGDPYKLLVLEKTIDVVSKQNLLSKAIVTGIYLRSGLLKLQSVFPNLMSATRGRGMFCAVDFKDAAFRDKVLAKMLNKGKRFYFLVAFIILHPSAVGLNRSLTGLLGD